MNLVITMVLGGLWHGITGTFAVWGLLHGVALAASRRWRAWRRGRPEISWSRPLRIFATYQFVCLTWVFFRASSLANAADLLGRIGSLSFSLENVTIPVTAVLLAAIGAHFVAKHVYVRAMNGFAMSPSWVHAGTLAAVAIVIELFAGHNNAPFMYSRF